MKIFIIFLCFIVLAGWGLIYSQDLNHYSLVQKSLKRAAEECAEAGALCRASDGKIDKEQAVLAAEEMAQILVPSAISEITLGDYSVTVKLTYTEDIFRLPGFSEKTMVRSACYKWE